MAPTPTMRDCTATPISPVSESTATMENVPVTGTACRRPLSAGPSSATAVGQTATTSASTPPANHPNSVPAMSCFLIPSVKVQSPRRCHHATPYSHSSKPKTRPNIPGCVSV